MATKFRYRPGAGRRAAGRGAAARYGRGAPIGDVALAGESDALVAIPRPLFDRLLSLARVADPELEIEVPVERTPVEGGGEGQEASVRLARCLYQLRRSRDLHLDEELFAEPAWDLLLYLYVRTREGRATCVSAATRGAAAPQTTALRWINRLEEEGLIAREGDRHDARRSHVQLTRPAMVAMQKLLRDLRFLLDSALRAS